MTSVVLPLFNSQTISLKSPVSSKEHFKSDHSVEYPTTPTDLSIIFAALCVACGPEDKGHTALFPLGDLFVVL